jgi:hypothetical protein
VNVLDALEAAERSATPGPWAWPHDNTLAGDYGRGYDSEWAVVAAIHDAGPVSAEDAALIALLRNHAADLIAVARAAHVAYDGFGEDDHRFYGSQERLAAALVPLLAMEKKA